MENTIYNYQHPLKSAMLPPYLKEATNKSIPFSDRQARHKLNQQLTIRPKPVEGINQKLIN